MGIKLKYLYSESYISLYESKNFSRHINRAIYDMGIYYKHLLHILNIGYSVQGIPILAIKFGCGSKKILVQSAHHARECITTILAMDQIRYIINLIEVDGCIGKMKIGELLEQITFIYVPLVNPDGADLVLNGLNSVSESYKNKPYLDEKKFRNWKANINGVDLNKNYSTNCPAIDGSIERGFEKFPGYYSFSEPETQSLRRLTEKYKFDGTISYHSSGEEIYWYYNQIHTHRDFIIANEISKETGYKLVPKEVSNTGSGYKDWFIEQYEKPGLTIEVSPYVGPVKVPIENYNDIWQKNRNVPILFAQGVLCLVN